MQDDSDIAHPSDTFAIDNYGLVSADLEGLLWLTVNDASAGFGDNLGSLPWLLTLQTPLKKTHLNSITGMNE